MRSRSRRRVRAAATAARPPERHKASSARFRSPRSRNSIGVLPPMSIVGRKREHAQFRLCRGTGRAEQLVEGEHLASGSPARSACRPAVARSATGRAPRLRSAVPSATLAINSSRNGRRSVPPNAIVVSLAMPIRSAHGGAVAPVLSLESDCMQELPVTKMDLDGGAAPRSAPARIHAAFAALAASAAGAANCDATSP